MQNIPWQKIKALEEEIKALKSLGKKTKAQKKTSKSGSKSLYGIIKDAPEITWEEFQQTKKVLFTHLKSHLK